MTGSVGGLATIEEVEMSFQEHEESVAPGLEQEDGKLFICGGKLFIIFILRVVVVIPPTLGNKVICKF